MKQPAIYIMTNKKEGVLYTGVTSNLIKRVFEHKNKFVRSFTKKYNCANLVYFELHDNMESAILREKQIKSGTRQRKLDLIQSFNPEWRDLYEEII